MQARFFNGLVLALLFMLSISLPGAALALLIDDFSGNVPSTTSSTSSTTGQRIGGEIEFVNVQSTFYEELNGSGTIGKTAGRRGIARLDYDGLDDSAEKARSLDLELTRSGQGDTPDFAIDVSAVTGTVLLNIELSTLDVGGGRNGIGFTLGGITIDRPGIHVIPWESFLFSASTAGGNPLPIFHLSFEFSEFDEGDRVVLDSISVIPEPTTALLLSLGLLALAMSRNAGAASGSRCSETLEIDL